MIADNYIAGQEAALNKVAGPIGDLINKAHGKGSIAARQQRKLLAKRLQDKRLFQRSMPKSAINSQVTMDNPKQGKPDYKWEVGSSGSPKRIDSNDGKAPPLKKASTWVA